MSIEIVDNFLKKDDFQEIKNSLESKDIPWFFNRVISRDSDSKEENKELAEIYNYQFTHIFYNNFCPNSQYFSLMVPLIKKLNPKALVKIKANLQPRTHTIIENGFHFDYEGMETCVFYINTNNGYTKFKSGEIVKSQENTAVIFNSDTLHTGSTCTDEKARLVININYVGFDQ